MNEEICLLKNYMKKCRFNIPSMLRDMDSPFLLLRHVFLESFPNQGQKASVLRSKSYVCILQVHRNAIRYVHPYGHTTGKQKIKATGKDWQKRSGKDPAKLGLHILEGFLV